MYFLSRVEVKYPGGFKPFIEYIICSKTLPLQLAIGADDSMATTRLRAIGLAIAARSRKSEVKNSNSIYFLIPCHLIF